MYLNVCGDMAFICGMDVICFI